jgi:hypothetical protein
LGEKYPFVTANWHDAWEHVVPFFVFPPDFRRVDYTTNAIEGPNIQLRKIIKTRGHFPTDEGPQSSDLAGDQQCAGQAGSNHLRLEERDESVRRTVRRSLHAAPGLNGLHLFNRFAHEKTERARESHVKYRGASDIFG